MINYAFPFSKIGWLVWFTFLLLHARKDMHCWSFNHLLPLQPVMYLFFGCAVFLAPPDQIIHGAPKESAGKNIVWLRPCDSAWRRAIAYVVNPCLPRARKVPSCLSLNSIPVLFCQVAKLLSLAGLPGDWMKIGTNGDLHSPVWYNMETGGRFHLPATFVMVQWLPPILVDHQCCHALQLLSTNGWSYYQWGTHESTIDCWGRTQVFYARSRFCARSYNMFNWIAFWTVGFTRCRCRNSIVTIALN